MSNILVGNRAALVFAEAMAAKSPAQTSPLAEAMAPGTSLERHSAPSAAAASVRTQIPEPSRATYTGELPDPPSPTMLSEAAARSRSKATPAAVGPKPIDKSGAAPQGGKQPAKSSAWTWRKSFSRPGSASGASKPTAFTDATAASMAAGVGDALLAELPRPRHDMHASYDSHETHTVDALDAHLPADLHLPDPQGEHAQTHHDDMLSRTGSKTGAPGPNRPEDTSHPGQVDSSDVDATVSDDHQEEHVNAQTGLTASQHQQLLDEGHFGGWSSTNGIIKREMAARAKSGVDLPPGVGLGSRQNSRDLGLAGSSPERRSFWGIRHTHAAPMGSSPPISSSPSLTGHPPKAPSPVKPAGQGPSRAGSSTPFETPSAPHSSDQHQPSGGSRLAQESRAQADIPHEASEHGQSAPGSQTMPGSETGSASLPDGSTPRRPTAPDRLSMPGETTMPSLSSPFGASGPQEGFSNDPSAAGPAFGSLIPVHASGEASEFEARHESIPAVHASPISPQAGLRARTGGLVKLGRRQSSHGRLEGDDHVSDQADAAPRTPSSSSSVDGSRRSRASFTQSVAKLGQLGRGALENLQDLQTAAHRAFSSEPTCHHLSHCVKQLTLEILSDVHYK